MTGNRYLRERITLPNAHNRPRTRPALRPAVRDGRAEERPSRGHLGPLDAIPVAGVNFTVPGNPVPWERVRTKKGQFFTPPKTRFYQQVVRLEAARSGARPVGGSVKLSMAFYRKDRQPCDLDNLAKTVQDALNGVAYGDDRQIVVLSAVKAIDAARPRAEVSVEYLAEPAGGGAWAAAEDHEDVTAERAKTEEP